MKKDVGGPILFSACRAVCERKREGNQTARARREKKW